MTTRESIVLNIENLTAAYRHGDAWKIAVRDFSLRIRASEVYGLVGESGSGKTTLALAIMRFLGEQGSVLEGTIKFLEQDLLLLTENDMRQIWGAQLSLVPQEPLASLNPAMRIGDQLVESLRHHRALDRRAAQARAVELLAGVSLADPHRVANSYPHELSGGMQQRVLIAMALSTEPSLLVLDEPTTGLDVTTEAAILDLMRELMLRHRTAVLYVSHNLGVIARICDRVAVLYASELVEDAATSELFQRPLHPYTFGLLQSVPRLTATAKDKKMHTIAGQIPQLDALPSGCVFTSRCPLAIERCHRERPALDNASDSRRVRCHRWQEILSGDVPLQKDTHDNPITPAERSGDLLNVSRLRVEYPVRRSLRQVVTRRSAQAVKAVDQVDLTLRGATTVGLVGESGSGKSSLARAIVGLVENVDGVIELVGVGLPPRLSQRNKDTLCRMQMIFQNPQEALNPYLTVGETLSRPLIALLGRSRNEAQKQVAALLTAVRLPTTYADRLPGQLSGGERQRVAIARAFASQPDVLICDEPVSALDVSVQATIMNLLTDLQSEHGTGVLFISHDIAAVSYLADVIAVIYLGKLMQVAATEDLLNPPYHPYTEALLSAVPIPDPDVSQEQIRLEGDVPSALKAPTGCPFHPRCPRELGDICVEKTPAWQTGENGKRIFCHIPWNELRQAQDRVIRELTPSDSRAENNVH